MDTAVTPPLPAGFKLDGPPPLPPGFTLDAAVGGTAGPPTANNIPGQSGMAPPSAVPASKPGIIDTLTSGPITLRTLIQNALATGVGQIQGAVENMGNGPGAKARADELTQRYSYQPTNTASQQSLSMIADAADSEPMRQLQALGPGGGVPLEIANLGITAPAAAQAARVAAPVVSAVTKPVVAVAEAAKGATGRAGAALGRGADLLSGKTAEEAANALKTTIQGEAGSQANTLAANAAEDAKIAAASTGRPREVAGAQEIASAKSTVADKVRAKAEAAAANEKAQLDALHANGMSNEDIGKLIQERGTGNLEAAKSAREKAAITDLKDPAFEEARARAAAGDFLTNNPKSAPIIQEARKQFLQQIEDMRLTPEEKTALTKKADALFGGEPMTLHQGEYLRRFFNDPLTRDAAGFGAIKAHDMGDLGQTMTRAMTAYEPRVGKYINEYRAGSEKIDRIAGTNAARAATDSIVGEGEDIVRNQKPILAHNYFLKGDQAGAQKLIDLVGGKTPEITDAVKANLRTKLEGLTADQATELASKNMGLLREFPELKPMVNQIIKAKAESERLGKMVPMAQKRAVSGFEESAKAGTDAEKVAATRGKELQAGSESAQKLADSINHSLAKLEKAPPEEVTSAALSIADNMHVKGLIDDAKYQDLLKQIRDTKSTYGKTDKARSVMKGLLYTVGAGAAATTGMHLVGH